MGLFIYVLYLWDVNNERQILKFRWFIIGVSDKHSNFLNYLKAPIKRIITKKNSTFVLFFHDYVQGKSVKKKDNCIY